jgi:hypothetical protein
MLNQFRKVLRNALMGAFVALGGSGAAQATLVVGVFDPLFGPPLTGVSFSGEGVFNISHDCLTQGYNLFVYAFDKCGASSANMSFGGADVDFTGTKTGSLIFGSGQLQVLGMYVLNDKVIGIQTTLSTAATATGGLAGDQFEIIFGETNPTHETAAQEGTTPTGPDHPGDGDMDDQLPGVFQVTSLFLVNGPGCSQAHPCVSGPAATSFVIPEPGSLSLALAALGVGWLVRRKKPGTLVAA